MNYKKIYKLIVKNAKKRGLVKFKLDGYYEKHHIKPKCIGGDDKDSNLVLLKAKEHFLCHHLLYKIHNRIPKLVYAYKMMSSCKRYDPRLTDKESDIIGKLFAKMASDMQIEVWKDESYREKIHKIRSTPEYKKMHSDSIKTWINDHPKEWKARINKINKNPEKIQKMADAHRGMKRSDESKKRMSKAGLGKRKGKNNGAWNGYYITPKGKFENSKDACKANKIRMCSLHIRCKYRNLEKITPNSIRSGDVVRKDIGKTWKQLGWGFKKV